MSRKQLPIGWSHSYNELEDVYGLEKIYKRKNFIKEVYERLSFLTFMGHSYNEWEMPDNLINAFTHNYAVVLCSIIEALLAEALFEKDYSKNIASKNLYSQGGLAKLLDIAEKRNIISKNKYNFDLLRNIRNKIHLTASTKDVIDSYNMLSVKVLNEYLDKLDELIQDIKNWL